MSLNLFNDNYPCFYNDCKLTYKIKILERKTITTFYFWNWISITHGEKLQLMEKKHATHGEKLKKILDLRKKYFKGKTYHD